MKTSSTEGYSSIMTCLIKNCTPFIGDSAYSFNLYLDRWVFIVLYNLHHSVGVDKRIKKM